MLWKSLALAYIANAQSPTYGKCSDDSKFDAKLANVKMEIVPQLTNSVIQVKGNIVITDKCNFESQNFTFINGLNH